MRDSGCNDGSRVQFGDIGGPCVLELHAQLSTENSGCPCWFPTSDDAMVQLLKQGGDAITIASAQGALTVRSASIGNEHYTAPHPTRGSTDLFRLGEALRFPEDGRELVAMTRGATGFDVPDGYSRGPTSDQPLLCGSFSRESKHSRLATSGLRSWLRVARLCNEMLVVNAHTTSPQCCTSLSVRLAPSPKEPSASHRGRSPWVVELPSLPNPGAGLTWHAEGGAK